MSIADSNHVEGLTDVHAPRRTLVMPRGSVVWIDALEQVPIVDHAAGDDSLESAELLSDDTGELRAVTETASNPVVRTATRPPPSAPVTQRIASAAPKPPPLPAGKTGALPTLNGSPATGPVPRMIVPPRGGEAVRASVLVPTPAPPPPPREAVDDVASFMAEIVASESGGAAPGVGRISDAEWFAEIFDESWLSLQPDHLASRTAVELDFVRASLRLPRDGAVLDVACGFGRHAIGLAQLGYDVTGLDLSRPLLQAALADARQRGVAVKFVHGDMREMPFDAMFDGLVSLGGSFGYFDDFTNIEVLRSKARAVRPGGRIVLELVNRDYIATRTPRRRWWEAGSTRVLEEVNFDARTSRLRVVRSLVQPEREPWEQRINIRLYSVHEICALCEMVGLSVLDVTGDLAHPKVYLGESNRAIWLTVQRPR